MAFIILDNCFWEFFFSWHSRILTTKYPSSLSFLETFLSRFRFFSILSFQYFLFVFGILPFWHLQPCQKQPSTKTHNLYCEKTKSGLPNILELRLHPDIRFALNNAISFSSVLLFPLERICDIISERFSFEIESISSTPISYNGILAFLNKLCKTTQAVKKSKKANSLTRIAKKNLEACRQHAIIAII